ncbi:MAG TPA: GAF domain-containing sensor histidine kinase, partial [Gemmatimonadaceae bacterium]|nr:GAF domain-containing sensor histidine kinase [Gemmatimonadaceae bacterium]
MSSATDKVPLEEAAWRRDAGEAIATDTATTDRELPHIYPTHLGPFDAAELDEAAEEETQSRIVMRESLDTLIRLIERVAPGMRGSVLLLDADGVTLHHGAAPSLPTPYCRAIDGAQIGPSAGSCGTAAFRKQRVVVRDITTDPLWQDYRRIAEPFGLAACWSTPILDNEGTVLGTFAMYYDEPRNPTDEDLALTETATLLARNIIKRARATTALRARTKAAERLALALQESEARFRMMAETIPVQVWTARPDGMLDFVTQRTAAYFGVPAQSLLGEGWAALVHPDDIERAASHWKRALETGEAYEVEFRVRDATGEFRWQLVRADPMRAPDGQVIQWFGCTADIEQQKRMEAALDDALGEARHANKVKADFLAMMSHELRTPLNAIGGYTQLMIDGIPGPVTESQQNFLQRVLRSQQHLLGLIESVLTHARLEAGKVTYRITDVLAHEILEVIDPLTAPQRAAKRIAYRCDDTDPKMKLRADKDKVVQIMLNLLSNAAKFTPTEGTITVSTSVPAPEVGAFSVRDTGIGMSDDQLAIVFEPFVQFDSKLARESSGTGLGMPISRELARGMG